MSGELKQALVHDGRRDRRERHHAVLQHGRARIAEVDVHVLDFLIKHSKAVVTVSGSSSLEALFFNKPGFLFSETEFSSVDGINLFDENPPLLYDAPDFSFDTRVHDPRGRMLNIQFELGLMD